MYPISCYTVHSCFCTFCAASPSLPFNFIHLFVPDSSIICWPWGYVLFSSYSQGLICNYSLNSMSKLPTCLLRDVVILRTPVWSKNNSVQATFEFRWSKQGVHLPEHLISTQLQEFSCILMNAIHIKCLAQKFLINLLFFGYEFNWTL